MNIFAKIILVEEFELVTYYTVQIEDEENSLFEQFFKKHTLENKTKLNHIMSWISKIGDKVGATIDYFRNEAETADTSALPPYGVDREPTYVEYNEDNGNEINTPNNLRLYCFRANEHVVFLFNGDIKTTELAQDCDRVRPHFRMANKLTQLLQQEFGDRIIWNEDQTDIIIDDNLELEL